MSRFKYSVGPWNVHEGADAYGPETRETISLEEKMKKFKEMGFDAIQFHDDDAVPNFISYCGTVRVRTRMYVPGTNRKLKSAHFYFLHSSILIHFFCFELSTIASVSFTI